MTKANLFIVGMSKCGTTSLHKYLNLHGQIYMSNPKEPRYFIKDFLVFPHGGPGDKTIKNVIVELDDYKSLFADSQEILIRGESSSEYLYYNKSAELIKEYNQDAKIIIILRNPAERSYSAYTHLRRYGREMNSFEYALEEEENRIKMNYACMWHLKNMSIYSEKVKHFLNVFSKDQVKVILSDDFKDNTGEVLKEIFSFLGVQAANFKTDKLTKYNVSGIPKNKHINKLIKTKSIRNIAKKIVLNTKTREKINSAIYGKLIVKDKMRLETREMLIEYFLEDINKLEDLLGVNLSKWKE